MRVRRSFTSGLSAVIAVFLCILLVIPPLAAKDKKGNKGKKPANATEDAGSQNESLPSGWLEAACINVGKGDATIVRLPDGRTCLIDTGYAKTADTLINAIRKRGIKTLDLLVLTHRHKDHAGGYPAIVKAFPIGRVVEPFDSRDSSKTLRVRPGDVLIEGKGFKLTTLGPSAAFNDENDASLVTKLEFGNTSILFAADVLGMAQADLLKNKALLRADLLKVPHHGTYKGSSPDAFFTAVRPRYAVITCDEENGDTPDEGVVETLQKLGATVLRTDESGDVVFRSDGTGLTLRP